MEISLFPFRLKLMCLNGGAVEVKWENLKFSPIAKIQNGIQNFFRLISSEINVSKLFLV
jgi:hypothetical protein